MHLQTIGGHPVPGVRRITTPSARHIHSILALGGLLLLYVSGCAPDDRISVAALRQMSDTTPAESPPIEPTQLPLTELQPYRVVRGDVLSITLLGLREDSYAPVEFILRVHNDGTITPPVVGPVKVADLTLPEAEHALIEAHRDVAHDLSVYVRLSGPENTTVLVHGAVTSPGLIRLPWNERNILYAVSAAGGFFPAGSGQVRLEPIRPERDALVFDFNDINDVRRALSAPPLESGDVLTVASQPGEVVLVTGLVNAPGPVAVPHEGNVSLVRTVAAAGGLRDFLDPQEATLWRVLPTGEQVRVKVDLTDVLAGKAEDLALYAGDVLEVPHTAHTRFREWVAQNIRLGPFGVTAVYDPVAVYESRVGRTQVNSDRNGLLRDTLVRSLINAAVPPVPAPVSP